MYLNFIISNLVSQIVLLIIFKIIYQTKKIQLTKDKINSCFEAYRSINCVFFSFSSLLNIIFNHQQYYPFLSKHIFLPKYDFNLFDIRTLFLNYILIDFYYIIRYTKIRLDLFFHHLICLYGIFILIYQPVILHYLLLLESVSALNFIKYLYIQKWSNLLIYYWKGISILFVRFPFHVQYIRNLMYYKESQLYSYFSYNYFGLVLLDLYWIYQLYKRIC